MQLIQFRSECCVRTRSRKIIHRCVMMCDECTLHVFTYALLTEFYALEFEPILRNIRIHTTHAISFQNTFRNKIRIPLTEIYNVSNIHMLWFTIGMLLLHLKFSSFLMGKKCTFQKRCRRTKTEHVRKRCLLLFAALRPLARANGATFV